MYMKVIKIEGMLESVEGHKSLNGKRVVFLKEMQSQTPQPRMTVRELANLILPRLDKIDGTLKEHSKAIVDIKNTLVNHGKHLDGIDARLDRNNLKP